MNLWNTLVRRQDASHFGGARVGDTRRSRYALGTWVGHGDIARRALLKQQLGSLHDGLGVESVAHSTIEQDVAQCDECHALVVSHVGLDDCKGAALRDAATRVVERLKESVTTAGAEP